MASTTRLDLNGPFQCLDLCDTVLIAASASQIYTFSLNSGLWLSTWTYPPSTTNLEDIPMEETEDLEVPLPQSEPASNDNSESEPPSKRRRLSTGGEADTDAKGLDQKDGKIGKVKKPKPPKIAAITPSVAAITSTNDGTHVIAITGEDKTVRVFEHDGEGILTQLSARTMPKRPCALTLAPDQITILCADKFGDVYALPLVPTEKFPVITTDIAPDTEEPQVLPFVSSANNLTVHSQRNLRALEHQLRQNQQQKEKKDLQFEHKLLLGHVSMLTDIIVVERYHNYIVTADRDEHIRISRGIPQAHITEGYCLGHKEFVNRLCFPRTASRINILISGGGDDELFVWKFPSGQLRQKLDLRSHVEEVVRNNAVDKGEEIDAPPVQTETLTSIAVSGILFMEGLSETDTASLIVTCEGLPALFHFTIAPGGTIAYKQTIQVSANPLDMVYDNIRKILVVSVDNVHEPCSKTQVRVKDESVILPLQVYDLVSGIELQKGSLRLESSVGNNASTTGKEQNQLGVDWTSLLYGLENLRKRGAED